MKITVFGRDACVQCNYTKVHLEKNGLTYEYVNVETDKSAERRLMEAGFTLGTGKLELPVVEIDHGPGRGKQYWQGFKLEKIRGLDVKDQ